ncbi:MAG: HAD superfamily hydrolase (TIGR01509 family) [Bacteriovoracaceae bacterium]
MLIKNKDLGSFEGLVFDLDGTLIDSMPIHNKAWLETLEKHGFKSSNEELMSYAGIASVKIVERLNLKHGLDLHPQEISDEKEVIFKERFNEVQLAQEVLDLAIKYKGSKKISIVTGGERETVAMVLERFKMKEHFPVVICAEDTIEGKDTPAPFLLAAQKMGVDPSSCLFFDDGDAGLNGALKAGMQVLKVDLSTKEIYSEFN